MDIVPSRRTYKYLKGWSQRSRPRKKVEPLRVSYSKTFINHVFGCSHTTQGPELQTEGIQRQYRTVLWDDLKIRGYSEIELVPSEQ